MPTKTLPLDYATRTALAAVEQLLVTKAISAADAERLRDTITDAYHQPPPASVRKTTEASSFAALVERNMGLGMNPDQAWAMAKLQSPAAYDAFRGPGMPQPVDKAHPASPPSRSATDTWMHRIAEVQAETPALSFVQASDVVRKEAPELYDAYLWATQHPGQPPRPVTKAATLSPEAVLKQARDRATANQTSCRAELWQLRTAYEGTAHVGAVAEAWRRHHVSDAGIDEWYAARVGTVS